MEVFVHVDLEELPRDLVSIAADIPSTVIISHVRGSELAPDWQRSPALETVVDIGTAWANSGSTAILAVPSAIIPNELNYLLNPLHRDFAKIRIGRAEPFSLDPRMWKR